MSITRLEEYDHLALAELTEARIPVADFGLFRPFASLSHWHAIIGNWSLTRIAGCWKAEAKLGSGVPREKAVQFHTCWYGSVRVFGFPPGFDPRLLSADTLVTRYYVDPGQPLTAFANFLRSLE